MAHPGPVIFDLMIENFMGLRPTWWRMLGLRSFAQTSGGKGFHIVVPLTRGQGWEEVKLFSQAVAQHMARVVSQRFPAVLTKKNEIFVDYLRNGRSASTVGAPV